MIKMFFTPIILFFFIFIVGLSFYLQPNDLMGCDKSPNNRTNCVAVDAIVTVSGGDTKARVDHAISLYKNGWSTKLIFSGAAQDKTGPSNASAMRRIALTAGIPDSNIYIDEYAETTRQNALNSQTIFAEHGIKKIILVTSGYHQRRASLEFNKRTDNVVILNSPVGSDKDWSFWWWFSPYSWWLAIGEFMKIVIFYVVGIWS